MPKSASRSVLAAIVALFAGQVSAAPLHHETEYRVALAGIPIARASFVTDIRDNKHYTISGDISAAGLADLVTDITARTSVDGVIGRNKLQADRYYLYYKSGRKAKTYEVKYRNGDITSATIEPKSNWRPRNWIEVSDSDMRAVLDPISGLVFPEKTKICPQTLPIFDGESRMDLVLTPKGSQPFSTKGFSSDALVCNVRYVPKSGYKKGRKDIEYLSHSNSMEIWFAKADDANVYAPVYVRIPTQYGTVTITAVKYGS